MLKYRNDILCSGVLKQRSPRLRIKLLCLELGNEVFVTELSKRPIGRYMMLIDRRTFQVHLTRVPLAAEGWYRIHTPMDEDAELRIPIPFRGLVVGERVPVRLEWTFHRPFLHFRQQSLPRLIIFGTCFLPCRIDLACRLRCCALVCCRHRLRPHCYR